MNEQNEDLPESSKDDPTSSEELESLELQLKRSAEKKAHEVIEKTFQQLLSPLSKKPSKNKITREIAHTVVKVEGVFMQSSGPLPPPIILHNYNKIVPGSGQIIVKMAEKESNHRHKMDEEIIKLESCKIKSDALNQRLGMACALILGSLVISSTVFLVYAGKAGAGLIISGVLFGSIMLAFIHRK